MWAEVRSGIFTGGEGYVESERALGLTPGETGGRADRRTGGQADRRTGKARHPERQVVILSEAKNLSASSLRSELALNAVKG